MGRLVRIVGVGMRWHVRRPDQIPRSTRHAKVRWNYLAVYRGGWHACTKSYKVNQSQDSVSLLVSS
jgi:hypothetical protein